MSMLLICAFYLVVRRTFNFLLLGQSESACCICRPSWWCSGAHFNFCAQDWPCLMLIGPCVSGMQEKSLNPCSISLVTSVKHFKQILGWVT